MSGRDELAKLLFIADNSGARSPEHEWQTAPPDWREYAYKLADAALAAGYIRPTK